MKSRLFALLGMVLAFCICLPLGMRTALAESDHPIYVNGSTGSDSNPGTEDAPVKTFAKVKELLPGSGFDFAYVSGALKPSGDETWDLGGKMLQRASGYYGELIHVGGGAKLTLANIVVDGGIDNGSWAECTGGSGEGGSIVGVFDGGALTIAEGATLQNNYIRSEGHWYPEAGGGVFAKDAGTTVNVEGGTIRNNSAVRGGGIYGCDNAVINMSSGTITGNHAVDGTNSNPDLDQRYGGSGGGICVFDGADINLSGGTISGNDAFERGGGISVGTFFGPQSQSVLTMTGGTIDGNSAGSGGGGIFVQYGDDSAYSIATITGGSITNNAMTGEGDDNGMFGGGGIYVNGIGDGYTGWHDAELYLSNVEVANNSTKVYGGGYAACPASVTEINLTNGSVFYNNKADEGANELYILAATWLGTHSGNPPYEISPSMLGGGAYRWTYDDGSEVPLDDLKGVLDAWSGQELSLGNALTKDDPGVQKALGLAKVHITGNSSATRGGGIGSNGTVFIGKSVETTEIKVTKTWNDGSEQNATHPGSVLVNLYRDGQYVGFQKVTPDSDGNWTATFQNLPKNDPSGHVYDYTVEERKVEGYVPEVSGSAAEGFVITNTPATSVQVKKSWVGPVAGPVTVKLLADGHDTDRELALNEGSGWKGSFDDLPKYAEDGHAIAYSVRESDVPDGYEASDPAGDAATGFTITNTNVEKVHVQGSKTWDDDNDRDGLRPASITVRLLAGQTEVASKEVTAEQGWSWDFGELPKYDGNGSPISYRIVEDKVGGYASTTSETDFDVTNTHSPSVTFVKVEKVWDDADNASGKRPASVRVQLTANGKATGDAVELSAANGWKHSWDKLPVNEAGKKVTYAVQEVEVPDGYASEVTGNAGEGFTITNKLTTTPPDKTPKKPKPETPSKATPKPKPATPKTGDDSASPIAPLLASACALSAGLALRRGARRED
ncbi:Cna B-type domain-containing protein [Olsenella phocaeensis]|uniref:Cna B-type domain-containing protein n=1 Tax=Olsenella phocaeensis TaxID=1852385 RepID=UPI000930E71A|nr:Cna B-type domain-containing protein [Olsenella phocaeensis]